MYENVKNGYREFDNRRTLNEKHRFCRKDKIRRRKRKLQPCLHSCWGLATYKRRANLSFLTLPIKSVFVNFFVDICSFNDKNQR